MTTVVKSRILMCSDFAGLLAWVVVIISLSLKPTACFGVDRKAVEDFLASLSPDAVLPSFKGCICLPNIASLAYRAGKLADVSPCEGGSQTFPVPNWPYNEAPYQASVLFTIFASVLGGVVVLGSRWSATYYAATYSTRKIAFGYALSAVLAALYFLYRIMPGNCPTPNDDDSLAAPLLNYLRPTCETFPYASGVPFGPTGGKIPGQVDPLNPDTYPALNVANAQPDMLMVICSGLFLLSAFLTAFSEWIAATCCPCCKPTPAASKEEYDKVGLSSTRA
mmetsp:Transcript_20951/g.53565  ORF Transcript_20951/g.53565 Transcript_20951/m.53565 type:complete len:279 (-) Transcript_20951:223-1059(-)|eukprot:CAMPEP_0115836706 /NCGR_PEP_ID=MMETSP0287-20121206/4848_1 /TAXON_ID=412157 /ORGANISM="Chrysochromulina rotalis, Strain UIO044" /LENGTH=278 /DNA_ID=CAMNT_0003290203 /DNA_START=188 /DNA_END=1024 /DNA_ORIENTATION=-